MRQTTVSAPWIAFNRAGASIERRERPPRRRSAARSRTTRTGCARSVTTRYSARISAAIDEAIASSRRVAALAAAGRGRAGGRGDRRLDRDRWAPRTGSGVGSTLPTTPTAPQAQRAERGGRVASVLLAGVVLLAFSVALAALAARPPPRRGPVDATTRRCSSRAGSRRRPTRSRAWRNRRALFEDADGARRAGRRSRSGSTTSTASSSTTTASATPPATRCSRTSAAGSSAAVDGAGKAYRMGGDEFCVLADGRRRRATCSRLRRRR